MIIVVTVCAGILPFLSGIAIQAIFHKRRIPLYTVWAFALALVAVQWLIARKTPVRGLEQDMMSIVASIVIAGIFVNAGIRSCRAFIETRKQKQF